MTISEILKHTNLPLVEKEILLADLLQKDRHFLNSHAETQLTSPQEKEYLDRLRRRENHEPIAYISGYQEFYGRKFLVNKDVLIPRVYTERLVRDILGFAKGRKLTVVDVGTGSGCIALTLKLENPDLDVVATEVSGEALDVARKNAARFQIEDQVQFLHCSLLEGLAGKVDIIAANLPWLSTSIVATLPKEIKDWEPRVALHSGETKTTLYEQLFDQAKDKLNPGGVIFYEIDGRVVTAS